jgi:hypothetical protein
MDDGGVVKTLPVVYQPAPCQVALYHHANRILHSGRFISVQNTQYSSKSKAFMLGN